MIYLDSSALLKLLVEEQESAALAAWLSERGALPAVSSELSKIEVVRGMRRLDVQGVAAARALISQLDLIPLGGAVVEHATEVGEPLLRSLDAIHLASALSIREELAAFVAYDQRLCVAARASGLEVTQPGAPTTADGTSD